MSGDAPVEDVIGTLGSIVLSVLQLAVSIFMIVQAFTVKNIIEDHLMGSNDGVPNSFLVGRVKLSGLATFFLGIVYLQWAINRYIAGSRAA